MTIKFEYHAGLDQDKKSSWMTLLFVQEFMIATDMTSSGDPEEKLRWAFRMYDKDGSGEIDVDEMVDIFSLMYTVQVMQIAILYFNYSRNCIVLGKTVNSKQTWVF